jgi:ketosteroid isomerase-like protein
MHSDVDDLEARVQRIEAQLAIGQLPIRYAMAVDARDIDAWVNLFVEDVQVGRDRFGRDALREWIEPQLRTFRRSVHHITGHRIEIVDSDHATGAVYCRAEHEVGDRWIVIVVCYFDDYRRVDGEWLFARRRDEHFYAADVTEHPQAVGFNSWEGTKAPRLPERFPTWDGFWSAQRG